MSTVTDILFQLTKIEHGFKHITAAGDDLLKDPDVAHFEIAKRLIKDKTYQGRMLGTHLLGKLSPENSDALDILLTEVSKDENWRVQEMLAKAVDFYAKEKGYEKTLPEIKEWLKDKNPNVLRAVIEGLRIWTSRPYFKENPDIAIGLISQHKSHRSEYVRKSAGNALRDISRKYMDLIKKETTSWDQKDGLVAFTYKLVFKD